MMFLDTEKPIETCKADDCDDCTVNSDVHCHFRLKDLIYFLFISFPPFLIGGAGILSFNGWLLMPYIMIVIAFFGFIEIRVMCSHCPHYAESSTSLKCWANYGSPKIWKYRPGPMSIIEKTVFFIGFAVVWGYPLLFLILGKELFLLVVYLMTTIGLFMTLINFMCTQCMNFACPLNRVNEEVREQFFNMNPIVAKAWEQYMNRKKNDL